jgi:stress-induced morphogen
MPIAQKELHKILSEKFPEAQIEIVDLAGDDDHYSVSIIDKIFAGKTRIAQHKLVNEALGDVIKKQLHAMQLKTSDK